MANNYDQATVQPDFPNSSFTEFEYLLFIQFELAKWSIHELETSFASKYYQTAVGPKQADLFFFKFDRESLYKLSAEYWSKGRNVLSTSSVSIPFETLVDIDIPNLVASFIKNIEARISASYARKLFLVDRNSELAAVFKRQHDALDVIHDYVVNHPLAN